MSEETTENMQVSPYYSMFRRRASGDVGEDSSPLFEAGASNEKGITRIRVEQVEPKALEGFRGTLDWRATEEQILVEYGPGVYRLTAYQGSKAIDQSSVRINGDRDEWEAVRKSFVVGSGTSGGSQNKEVIALMRELMEGQKESSKTMSETMLKMQQEQSQSQLRVATDMASLHRVQAEKDLERLELQMKNERERTSAELQRLKLEHEQTMEREAARRRDELRAERERMQDERARDREYNALLFKSQDGQSEKMLGMLSSVKELFGNNSSDDGGDWKTLLMSAAPEILKALGPGDQQQVMQAFAQAQQETMQAQQAQQQAAQIAQQAQAKQIEAEAAVKQAQEVVKSQLKQGPPPPKKA